MANITKKTRAAFKKYLPGVIEDMDLIQRLRNEKYPIGHVGRDYWQNQELVIILNDNAKRSGIPLALFVINCKNELIEAFGSAEKAFSELTLCGTWTVNEWIERTYAKEAVSLLTKHKEVA